MKSKFSVFGLRGTIFLSYVPFDWRLVSSLLDELKDFIPSVNTTGVPLMGNGFVIQPGEWSLVSPDGQKSLFVTGQKIDYTENYRNVEAKLYSMDVIQEFSGVCTRVFAKIMDFANIKSTRIALAPTLRYNSSLHEFTQYVQNVYAKNTFKQANVDNVEFSQVYRVEEEIGSMTPVINYLSKFYVVNDVINLGAMNEIREKCAVDFDINTRFDPEYFFDKECVNAFFDKADKMVDSYFNFYFNE